MGKKIQASAYNGVYGNDYPILKLRQIEEHNKVKDVEKKEAKFDACIICIFYAALI